MRQKEKMICKEDLRRTQVVQRRGTKSICIHAAVGVRLYREKSPMLQAMAAGRKEKVRKGFPGEEKGDVLDQVPMQAVTAVMKASTRRGGGNQLS